MSKKCHDCGVHEGQLHKHGCDMERCPFCGGQLISCICCYKLLEIQDESRYGHETCFLPLEIYENGLNDEQDEQWCKLLEEKGRVPYIVWPNLCSRCGKLYPEMFVIPDEEWNKYVQINNRHDMLCKLCFDEIKRLIDSAKQK